MAKRKQVVKRKKKPIKLQARNVKAIRNAWLNGESQTKIAKKYGTHQSNISSIVNYHTWAGI